MRKDRRYRIARNIHFFHERLQKRSILMISQLENEPPRLLDLPLITPIGVNMTGETSGGISANARILAIQEPHNVPNVMSICISPFVQDLHYGALLPWNG